jgi:cytidyltransferase-like protein
MSAMVVAIGGTFDQLHDGHKALILEAFRLGERVVIGLTSDTYVKKEGKVGVARYGERRRRLLSYLKSNSLANRATLVKIDDRFGPTIQNAEISCIVVTEATREAALEANQLRAKNGMKPMKIHTIDLVLARDNHPISSSRIRKGEINEHGSPQSQRF